MFFFFLEKLICHIKTKKKIRKLHRLSNTCLHGRRCEGTPGSISYFYPKRGQFGLEHSYELNLTH